MEILTKYMVGDETICPIMTIATAKQRDPVICVKETCQWWDENQGRCAMIRTPMFKVDGTGNVERMW